MEKPELKGDQCLSTNSQQENSTVPAQQNLNPMPTDKSNYWQNPDGSIREAILEKARQILRGQY